MKARRPGRDRPRRRSAAEPYNELAALHLIEFHSVTSSQAGLQNIGLAGVSQRVSGRLHNLPAVSWAVEGVQLASR